MTESQMPKGWRIPDWTRLSDYPDPKRTSDRVWRWEFLRRNPEYRKHWDFVRRCTDPKDHFAKDGIWLVSDRLHQGRKYGYMLPAPQCVLDDELLSRLEDNFSSTKGGVVVQEGVNRSMRLNSCHPCVDYRFNMNEPLEAQFEKARNELTAIQTQRFGKKIYRRPRRSNWVLYLRILDARECGASWQKIGSTFWPRSKSNIKDKARHTYELAIAVRDNLRLKSHGG